MVMVCGSTIFCSCARGDYCRGRYNHHRPGTDRFKRSAQVAAIPRGHLILAVGLMENHSTRITLSRMALVSIMSVTVHRVADEVQDLCSPAPATSVAWNAV